MSRIKTGDVVMALKLVFPNLTADMVRSAAERGVLKTIRNPLCPRSGYFYDPESLKEFINANPEIPKDKIREVFEKLGINFNQIKLIA